MERQRNGGGVLLNPIRSICSYTTVHAVDGTAWYKQYAVDAVDKSPYMAPDGSIAFNESIVKKLPPAPRRKDKI